MHQIERVTETNSEQYSESMPILIFRASLMNVGFVESNGIGTGFTCFIFHDVDLLPEDDRLVDIIILAINNPTSNTDVIHI